MISNLAQLAGVHLYTSPGTVVFGAGNLISLQNDVSSVIKFNPKTDTCRITNLLTGQNYIKQENDFLIELFANDPILLKIQH
jgi:hypothetical protein